MIIPFQLIKALFWWAELLWCKAGSSPEFSAGFLLWLLPCSGCVGPADVHLMLSQGVLIEEVTCANFWLFRFMMYFFLSSFALCNKRFVAYLFPK